VAKDVHYRTFLAEALQHMANGVSADDLDAARRRADTSRLRPPPSGLLQVATCCPRSASWPRCRVIVTMGHGRAPAVIGEHIAAALVGTFLGILRRTA
jgi:hypothetical protein